MTEAHEIPDKHIYADFQRMYEPDEAVMTEPQSRVLEERSGPSAYTCCKETSDFEY